MMDEAKSWAIEALQVLAIFENATCRRLAQMLSGIVPLLLLPFLLFRRSFSQYLI